MPEILTPKNQDDLLAIVQEAVAGECPLEVTGSGSKWQWGRAVNSDFQLDLSGLTGISLYEPAELVLSAAAATPIEEIIRMLDENSQLLAFEPPDLTGLYGEEGGSGTLGGVIACNHSGSRRIYAGAARDHILGFEAVSGRGEIFKSGGRVVKNVTGFDLSKLMAGSFGTLAVMTTVTVKVMPKPDKARTILIYALSNEAGGQAMARALQSPYEVDGAAHLPAALSAKSSVSYVAGAAAAVTAIRIQGPAPSVEARCRALREALARFGETEELHGHNSRTLWQEIRDVSTFFDDHEKCIWRLSVPPAYGAGVADQIVATESGQTYFDWGGGLIWLAQEDVTAESALGLRKIVDEPGGHATLMRASSEIRASVPVFHPQPEHVAGLTKRLKENFDPKGVLNPGRMYEAV